MTEKTVEVQLATYNGARWLPELLHSLAAQQDRDFTLRVRDDGSTDGTPALLAAFARQFGARMILQRDGAPTGSAKGNFARLLAVGEADFLLWADQDDVWRPGKVGALRRLLAEGEARHGAQMPLYAFTDLVPTDAALVPLSESYFRFKQLDPERIKALRHSLVCPPVPGCASGINRALARLALPIPTDEVTGHDWWAFLLASAAGRLVHSTEPTVLYRQHGGNVSNQQQNSVASYARGGGKAARVRRGMTLRWRQARALSARLAVSEAEAAAAGSGAASTGVAAARQLVEAFTGIEARSAPGKRLALLRGGFVYPDLTRNLAMLALC